MSAKRPAADPDAAQEARKAARQAQEARKAARQAQEAAEAALAAAEALAPRPDQEAAPVGGSYVCVTRVQHGADGYEPGETIELDAAEAADLIAAGAVEAPPADDSDES